MNTGDRITLKNGHEALVIRLGFPDFIGDPYPVYVQYVSQGVVVQETLMSNELRKK